MERNFPLYFLTFLALISLAFALRLCEHTLTVQRCFDVYQYCTRSEMVKLNQFYTSIHSSLQHIFLHVGLLYINICMWCFSDCSLPVCKHYCTAHNIVWDWISCSIQHGYYWKDLSIHFRYDIVETYFVYVSSLCQPICGFNMFFHYFYDILLAYVQNWSHIIVVSKVN